MTEHPYRQLPDRAFWKRAVASRHYEDMTELWIPPNIESSDKFATAGSCFAQHIGKHISSRGKDNFLDLEVAPIGLPRREHERFGFSIFSCRYGNIYTSRQLLQLAEEALDERAHSEHVWKRGESFL